MKRMGGVVLMVIAAIIVVLGMLLGVQLFGHTEAWQVIALMVVALGLGLGLVTVGRRMWQTGRDADDE